MIAPLRSVPRWYRDSTASTATADEPASVPERPGEEGRLPAAPDESLAPDASAPEETVADAEEPDEDLPEYEPLTPEIVEDDAMRNDFMLRLVIVLLAFLLACTEISETLTLVHVKTGQYIAQHGWLPPRTDVFSYTAAERAWTNLSWLFDLFAAGVYSLGGAIGLSFAKALLAAVTFYLVVQAGRGQVSTWWGSICAALAILACVPQFTMRPELITLLGVATMLWLLRRWYANPQAGIPWLLVPVVLLWNNLDPRAFLGPALLILFAAGESVGALFGRNSLDGVRRKHLWIAAAAGVLAMLVNPFGWNSLTAPLVLYGADYAGWRFLIGPDVRQLPPALLQNYPMSDPVFWRSLNVHTVSALVLGAAAAISFVLHRQRTPLSHILVALGFLGFAVAGSHELAAASLVWAVLATLNAQEWYQANFRQTYSIDLGERLFSTGGRAVTALALIAVAYLAVSGRLMGRDGPRTGLGLDQPIQAAIAGLREDLAELRPDDRAFNSMLVQGDLMIWLGHEVFADERLALYAPLGDENLLDLHGRVRSAILSDNDSPISSDREFWRQTLNEYGVTHALAHLAGSRPNYVPYFQLFLSPDWQLTHLGPAAAVFCRRDLKELASFCDEHRVDFPKLAFETTSDDVLTRTDWARPPSWYETVLFLPEEERLNDVQLARHYTASLQLLMQTGTFSRGTVEDAAALAALAIRRANAALAENPRDAAAFHLLGDTYHFLAALEQALGGAAGGQSAWGKRRFVQTAAAYRQALIAAPDGPNSDAVRHTLRQVFLSRGLYDLCLELAREIADRAPDVEELNAAELEQLRYNRDIIEQIEPQVASVEEQVQQQIEKDDQGTQPLAASRLARSQGCVRLALRQLEQVPEETLAPMDRVQLQLFRGILLLEAGEAEQAHMELAKLEGYAEQFPEEFRGIPWRPQAALAALTAGDYPRAIELWNSEFRDYEQVRVQSLIAAPPLASEPLEQFHTERQELKPVDRAFAAAVAAASEETLADSLLNLAACHLEMGKPDRAEIELERVLASVPEAGMRLLAVSYLSFLREEPVDPSPPSDYIPVSLDIFAPEPRAR